MKSAAIAGVAGLIVAGAGAAVPSLAAARPSAPTATPRLRITAKIKLASARTFAKDQFAEAPNGAVYFSISKHVYVVNGNAKPKPAVTEGKPVVALAANASDYFVQTGLTVTEYTRSHNAKVRHWTLASPVSPITTAGLDAAGNTLWSWTDWGTDGSGFEYATVSRISTTSSSVKRVSSSNVQPGLLTAYSAGAYFDDSLKSALTFATPSGSTRHIRYTNIPFALALAAGRLDVLSPHSNGDVYIDSFNARTLRSPISKRVSSSDLNITGTSAGLVVLACAGRSCATSVAILNAATGASGPSLAIPHAEPFVLLAPQPAVLTDTGGSIYLNRLAA
jgi:hypothetical protein